MIYKKQKKPPGDPAGKIAAAVRAVLFGSSAIYSLRRASMGFISAARLAG